MFVMRLSASGRAYARAYLNAAQEVFLDGHVGAFEHFGGVPRRIRYDNSGLLRVRLTSHVWASARRKDVSHAQEVPSGVQA